MTHHFTDKICIVTGAASGIGAATARILAGHGGKVVLADIQDATGEALAKELQEQGHIASYIHADMADDGEIKAMVQHAIDTYGGLDVAINNAGIEGANAPMAEQDEAQVDRVFDINLKGVWRCMRHQIPALIERGGGAIVNVSSIAGQVGFQGAGPYTASKHGVIGLTKVAALDYADRGIRVNAVCPGVIDTAMVQRAVQDNPDLQSMLKGGAPMGRMGTPEEIGHAIAWLASHEASFVTGQSITPDGGWTVR